MAKKSKPVDQEARDLLASNLKRTMDRALAGIGDKPRELSKRAGVSKSTVQRACGSKENPAGASIDVIAIFARLLGVRPYELLMTPEETAMLDRARRIIAVADATSEISQQEPSPRGGTVGRSSLRTGTY